MGECIVITSGKGGVGKSVAVTNIGAGLAQAGRRVVLVDMDLGLRNLDLLLGLENQIVYDLADIVDGHCRVQQALVQDKRHTGLYLLPAAQTRDKSAVSPQQMRELCRILAGEFDYVLLDCPPGIGQGFRSAIAGAASAIVVTTAEITAIRDADRVIGLLETAGIGEVKVLINRIRPDMIKRGEMIQVREVAESLAVDVMGIVPEDEAVIAAASRGEVVVTGAASPAALAFGNIVRRILGETIPFADFRHAPSLWGRLTGRR